MSLSQWFRNKWVDRVRQFGLRVAYAQAIQAALRPIWQVNRYIVIAMPDHHPNQYSQHAETKAATSAAIEAAAKRGDLNSRQYKQLQNFLADGCWGLMAEIKGRLAGYGFIQPTGEYPFCYSGRFRIPKGMMVLKNLLVFPDFRGFSIGKNLNQARLAAIPEGCVPIVFVIVENRYAIRNLKMFGFQEILIVRRTTWFRKWAKQSIRILNDCEIAHRLILGLENNEELNRS